MNSIYFDTKIYLFYLFISPLIKFIISF